MDSDLCLFNRLGSTSGREISASVSTQLAVLNLLQFRLTGILGQTTQASPREAPLHCASVRPRLPNNAWARAKNTQEINVEAGVLDCAL